MSAVLFSGLLRVLLESERGKGGVTGISFNEARGAIYDFSRPIYHDDIHLVVLKGKEFPFQDIKDLKGRTAGGQSGASYGTEVDAAIAAGIFTVDRDSGQANRLKKLMLGRIDVAIIGNGLAGFEQLIASEPELKANRDKFVVLDRPLVCDPLYLAFAKSMAMKPALDQFNRAMVSFQKSSEYSRLVGSSN